MPSSEFQKTVRDLLSLSEIVNIRAHETKLTLETKESCGTHRVIFTEREKGLEFKTASSQPVGGRYSSKFLSLFAKSSSLSPTIEIFLKDSNTFPVVLTFAVGSLGRLSYVSLFFVFVFAVLE